jgi:hypothetical protein
VAKLAKYPPIFLNQKKTKKMEMITNEMLFENNVKKIVGLLENNYGTVIQSDFDNQPEKYPDLLTWMELHPEDVGKVFMTYIINYGFSNEDIN